MTGGATTRERALRGGLPLHWPAAGCEGRLRLAGAVAGMKLTGGAAGVAEADLSSRCHMIPGPSWGVCGGKPQVSPGTVAGGIPSVGTAQQLQDYHTVPGDFLPLLT